MVILRDLKDFRISNVHVAKDMPLSLVALKGPADIYIYIYKVLAQFSVQV